MRFRVGDIALYKHQYPCVVLEDDHSNIPYLVQFLSDRHPDAAMYDYEQKVWDSWCFKSELSPWEIVCEDPAIPGVDLSEVL